MPLPNHELSMSCHCHCAYISYLFSSYHSNSRPFNFTSCCSYMVTYWLNSTFQNPPACSTSSWWYPPPFLPQHEAIPSQSYLSEECCHWFDVAFSPDVFILDVVLLGLYPLAHFSYTRLSIVCIVLCVVI